MADYSFSALAFFARAAGERMKHVESPEILAQKLLEILQDADQITTDAALEITEILLRHRRAAQLEFERECKTAELNARLGRPEA